MGIINGIANFFKGSSHGQLDKYGILSPLMSAQEYAEATKKLLGVVSTNDGYMAKLAPKFVATSTVDVQTQVAYRSYLKGLANRDIDIEKHTPLASMVLGVTNVAANLSLVESKFNTLFGDGNDKIDEADIKLSLLIIVGYIQKATEYCAWIGQFVAHLSYDGNASLTPFETISLAKDAERFGDFTSFNLSVWNPHHGGILNTISTMQKRGVDVAIKAGGAWIDTFVHDGQFSSGEQDLMTSSLRNPILIILDASNRATQSRINLLTSRKDWLVAKTVLESDRLRGLDPQSAEYIRLSKIVDKYADLVSKYEQKIERARS